MLVVPAYPWPHPRGCKLSPNDRRLKNPRLLSLMLFPFLPTAKRDKRVWNVPEIIDQSKAKPIVKKVIRRKLSYTRYNFFCDLEMASTLLQPGCTYVWYEVDVVKEIMMIERLEKLWAIVVFESWSVFCDWVGHQLHRKTGQCWGSTGKHLPIIFDLDLKRTYYVQSSHYPPFRPFNPLTGLLTEVAKKFIHIL